mgnify:FL=1
MSALNGMGAVIGISDFSGVHKLDVNTAKNFDNAFTAARSTGPINVDAARSGYVAIANETENLAA